MKARKLASSDRVVERRHAAGELDRRARRERARAGNGSAASMRDRPQAAMPRLDSTPLSLISADREEVEVRAARRVDLPDVVRARSTNSPLTSPLRLISGRCSGPSRRGALIQPVSSA